MKGRSIERIVLAGWVCVLLAGFGALGLYANASGGPGVISSSWPAGSAIPRQEGRVCLVLFMHPRCPCTRSSVRQLEHALALSPGSVDVRVVVIEPSGLGDRWTKTGLVDLAGALPGAQVLMDRDGEETGRFGVRTSGHVLVFDGHGGLAFSGGVTPTRGHEGPCDGCDAVRQLVRGESPGIRRTPSYGCPILDPDSPCTGKEATCTSP